MYCLDPPTSSPKTAADLFEPSQPALPGLAGYDSPLALARSRSSSPPEHHRPKRRPRSRAPSDSPEGDPDFDPRLATDRKPKRSSTLSPGAGLRPANRHACQPTAPALPPPCQTCQPPLSVVWGQRQLMAAAAGQLGLLGAAQVRADILEIDCGRWLGMLMEVPLVMAAYEKTPSIAHACQ